MPFKFQYRPPVHQTPPIQTAYSYTVTMQNEDDDGDICPVCESECTCNKPPTQQAQPPAAQPPLKIRFTVPPSLLASLHSQNPKSHEKLPKLTTSASLHDDDAFPHVKRKRGRPTKAEAEARRAAEVALQGELTPTRLTRKSAPLPKSMNGRSQDQPKSTKKKIKVYHASSTESDSEVEGSVTFPTFVSTISESGTEEDRVVHDSDSSELSSLPDPGDDSSLEEEEERYLQDHSIPRERARVRRELLGSDAEDRRSPPRESWGSHLRRRTSSADRKGAAISDSDTETESEAQEDEDAGDADGEGDGEADDDADMVAPGGDVASDFLSGGNTWSDSEDEDFDADVFFASLSDSDGSTSGFDHVFQLQQEEDDDVSDELHPSPFDIGLPFDNSNAADFLAPFAAIGSAESATVLVSKDWNGQPIFTNGSDLAMGMLDIDFELNVVAQHQAAAQANDSYHGAGDEDEEMWIRSDDEADYYSEHGETTDEDTSVLRGVQTAAGVVMFRFPTPPISAINPLSTVSPATKKKSSSAKRRQRFKKAMKQLPVAPKPAELLARKSSMAASDFTDENSFDDTTSIGGKSSSLSSSMCQPVMGAFEADGGPAMQHFVINGDANVEIPSPMGKTERERRCSTSSRGRRRGPRTESPFSISRKRQCQSPVSHRSRSTETRNVNSTRTSPERAVPPEPMSLHDVLDCSMLDQVVIEDTDPTANEQDDNKFVSRWDRVPMATFRQSRNTGNLRSDGLSTVMEWAPNQSAAVSDGFCYGSPGGALMRSGPLFQSDPDVDWVPVDPPRATTPSSRGDRTPRQGDLDIAFGNTPPEQPSPRILSHKERRKAKRLFGDQHLSSPLRQSPNFHSS